MNVKRYLLGSLFLLLASLLSGQDLPRFLNWLDEEHFLVREGRQLLKVHAATDQREVYAAPTGGADFLPSGIRATWGNSTTTTDGQKVAVVHEGDLFLGDAASQGSRRLTANPGEEHNPTFSPDASHLAYTRDHNLFVMDLETGLERQLTSDGSDVISNGYASWVYYEEILGRGSRYKAFYWSPDSKKLAFLQFDDTEVPTFPIYHHEGTDMTHGYLEVTRYPKSGDPLPGVKLGIADLEKGTLEWVDHNPALDYVAWVFWTPDSRHLFYQQMNRDQDTLHLYRHDLATGRSVLAYEETQPTWVEFYTDLHFLENGAGFLVLSDRSGWRNIYLHDMEGRPVRSVTNLDWRVTAIEHVDESAGSLYFSGTGPEGQGTEGHLFMVRMDGTDLRQLTAGSGTHSIAFSSGGAYYTDNFTAFDHPGTLSLHRQDGAEVRVLGKETENANEQAGIRVEFFTVPSTDGFELPAYWVLPPDFDPNKKYPIVFTIYGGPDAGTVYNRYRSFANNAMVEAGIILFAVDHRASGKFGKKGLDYMHRSLGKWEMHDYIETVKWLRNKSFIDPSRVGISGGSYGGYMSAMALTYGADYFTHGVARSSVTDWRLYDNVYTERYMDTPGDNPEGYDLGSVMNYADRLKGKLLIIHGTIDDNVHMQNSIQLISKLQDLGKDFEFMIYPGGRHGWGGAKGVHSRELAEAFWMKHFFGK